MNVFNEASVHKEIMSPEPARTIDENWKGGYKVRYYSSTVVTCSRVTSQRRIYCN